MPAQICNPVLTGFHPDPSFLRVGDDYYIATSTFEWWPGVRIHHSRDLVHWHHLSYALTRKSQLDMRGNPDSGGIWAPCLSHHRGIFYLVFTNVRSLIGAYKDTHNHVVTSDSASGPWSQPVYLNSSGFDPSLFHDDDGRTWLLNMQRDHRPERNPFGGIVMQQYDREVQRLTGPVTRIFEGTPLGLTEAPHLYKRDGWYVLVTAEGGTGFGHAVTVARSRQIEGPYELSPYHPLLTAFGAPAAGLQRAGHASLVEAGSGEWFIACLCGRPVEWRHRASHEVPASYTDAHCPLGRETALQRVEWTADGWLRLADGGSAPASRVDAPALPPAPFEVEPERDDFDAGALSPHLNGLRVPFDESWVSLTQRSGHLRLVGRESLMSLFEQSLIARRQQHFDCEAETLVEFSPSSFQQMAGLVAYYNTRNHAYLHLTHDDALGRVLRMMVNDRGVASQPAPPLPIGDVSRVGLRVRFSGSSFQFHASIDGASWFACGPALNSSMLSDEHATDFDGRVARSLGFTGNFIGMSCQDLGGARCHADFDYFIYRAMSD